MLADPNLPCFIVAISYLPASGIFFISVFLFASCTCYDGFKLFKVIFIKNCVINLKEKVDQIYISFL